MRNEHKLEHSLSLFHTMSLAKIAQSKWPLTKRFKPLFSTLYLYSYVLSSVFSQLWHFSSKNIQCSGNNFSQVYLSVYSSCQKIFFGPAATKHCLCRWGPQNGTTYDMQGPAWPKSPSFGHSFWQRISIKRNHYKPDDMWLEVGHNVVSHPLTSDNRSVVVKRWVNLLLTFHTMYWPPAAHFIGYQCWISY